MSSNELTSANRIDEEALKKMLIESTVRYIFRVSVLNSDDTDNLKQFVDVLLEEFKTMCTIRKFTIVNTNVVRENQKRIFNNDTLRSFYLELFKSVETTAVLNYGAQAYAKALNVLGNAAVSICCHYDETPVDDNNHLNQRSAGFREFCGMIHVKRSSIENFLEHNPWYYMVILANIFAVDLFENTRSLITKTN